MRFASPMSDLAPADSKYQVTKMKNEAAVQAFKDSPPGTVSFILNYFSPANIPTHLIQRYPKGVLVWPIQSDASNQKVIWRLLCSEFGWANIWNMGGRNDTPVPCRGPIIPITELTCGENKPLTPEHLAGMMYNAIVEIGVADEGVEITHKTLPPSIKLALTGLANRQLATNFFLDGWEETTATASLQSSGSPNSASVSSAQSPVRQPRNNMSNNNWSRKQPESPVSAHTSGAGSSQSDGIDTLNGKLDLIFDAITGFKRRLVALESTHSELYGQQPNASQGSQ